MISTSSPNISTRIFHILTLCLLLACGIALFFFIEDAITPDMVTLLTPGAPVHYVYVHDDDQYNDRDYRVEFRAFTREENPAIDSVSIHIRRSGEQEYLRNTMEPLVIKGEPTSSYLYVMPRLHILQRYFFYFTIELSNGESVKVTQPKPWFAALLTGKGDWPFYVTFEGHVNKHILVLHITLVVAALFFLIHTLLDTFRIHVGMKQAFQRALSTMFWGWLLFAISVIPLGIVVTWQAFQEGWGGWPIGTDITDTKSEVVVLYWLLVLLLSRKGRLKYFPYWVYGGIVITTIVYLIPHSLFFVKW
ncbi:MAG TPA: hypothetical protein PK014_01780 [Thermoanaerobaculia bacterium]|nr:hypothetical protein [Thermoanaerobaculia bacterium]HUM28577.1 hypothetical protein [Thermoanaerobaculia bacterium]HXK66815.1 hypothetical protein [Thermoanaerobaculia bacterium]